MGSSKLISCFAFLVYAVFALPGKLPLSQPVSCHTFTSPALFPIPLRRVSDQLICGAELPVRLSFQSEREEQVQGMYSSSGTAQRRKSGEGPGKLSRCSKRHIKPKKIQKSIFWNSKDLRKETMTINAKLRLCSTLLFVWTSQSSGRKENWYY